ncbi:MAG: phosphate starvation-inducible protein PhoH, partial [Ilumatobacteraceae bacterium]
MPALLGSRDTHLRTIEDAFPDTDISVRGNEVRISGSRSSTVAQLFEELVLVLQRGENLDSTVVGRSIDMVNAHERPSTILTD